MKKLIVLTHLVFFINIGILTAQENSNALQFEEIADTLSNELKYDKAINYYIRATKIREKNYDWLYLAKNYRKIAWVYNNLANSDSALDYAFRADSILMKVPEFSKKVEFERVQLLKKIGVILFERGRRKEEPNSIVAFLKLVTNFLPENDTLLAEVYTTKGLVFGYQRKNDSSIYYFDRAIEIFKSKFEENQSELANCLYYKSKISGQIGNYLNAIDNIKKALFMYSISNRDYLFEKGLCYIDLALLNSITSQFDSVLIYNKKALKIFEKISDKNYYIARINFNIGNFYTRIGLYDKAKNHALKSLETIKDIRKSEMDILMTKSYFSLAFIFLNLKDYDKSLLYCNKVLNLLDKSKKEDLSDIYSAVYQTIGYVYLSKEDYKKSIEYFEKSLKMAINANGKAHPDIEAHYYSLSWAYLNLKEYEKAISYGQKSFDLCLKYFGNNHRKTAGAFANLGRIYSHQSNFQIALANFNEALKINQLLNGSHHPSNVIYHNSIAENYKDLSEYDSSLYHISVAISDNKIPDSFKYNSASSSPVHSKIYNSKFYLKSLYLKSIVFFLKYKESNTPSDIQNSLTSIQEYMYFLSDLIRNYTLVESKFTLNKEIRKNLSDIFDVAVKYQKFDKNGSLKPFIYLEQSKSVTLADHIFQLNIQNILPDSIKEAQQILYTKRNLLDTKLQKEIYKPKETNNEKVSEYQNKLFAIHQQEDSMLNYIRINYPKYCRLIYERDSVNIQKIHKTLVNNTALLNYFVADTSLFIAALTKDSLVYKVVKTDSLFNQLLTDYHIDIEFDFTKDELQASKKLYNYLVAPVEDLIEDKNKLVILPDEKLYYVPFETLCKKGEDINSAGLPG
jgi:tetratricopeptide (TPR) repeat protein